MPAGPKYLISPTEEEEDNSRTMTHMPITNTYVNRGDGLGFDPSYAFHSVGNKYGGPVAGSEWRFHCHGKIWMVILSMLPLVGGEDDGDIH